MKLSILPYSINIVQPFWNVERRTEERYLSKTGKFKFQPFVLLNVEPEYKQTIKWF